MKCPFCSKEIPRGAGKCKHCGEFLDGESMPRQKGLKQEVNHTLLMIIIFLIFCAVWYIVNDLNQQAEQTPSNRFRNNRYSVLI